eukprot:6842-Eustigmatos_ZCMA.PRE.1
MDITFTNMRKCPYNLENNKQRRFIFQYMDGRYAGDVEYFKKLYGSLERPDHAVQIAFYKWLMNRDITEYDRTNPKLPLTNAMYE